MQHSRAYRWVENLIYTTVSASRFTQRSPIMPDVWIRYGLEGPGKQDLLLMANHREPAGVELADALFERVGHDRAQADAEEVWSESAFAPVQMAAAARLSFRELMRAALPLSPWWHRYLLPENTLPGHEPSRFFADAAAFAPLRLALHAAISRSRGPAGPVHATADFVWLTVVAGSLCQVHRMFPQGLNDVEEDELRRLTPLLKSPDALLDALYELFQGVAAPGAEEPLWSVHRNRKAEIAIRQSTATVKADAARQVFGVTGRGICWAMLDTGIDATHVAFRRREGLAHPRPKPGPAEPWRLTPTNTRIVATYDFTNLRALMSLSPRAVEALGTGPDGRPGRLPEKSCAGLSEPLRARIEGDAGLRQALLTALRRTHGQFHKTLKNKAELRPEGRAIDWAAWEPLLTVAHDATYDPPRHKHGTHVAGILAADWRPGDLDDDLVVAELGQPRRLVERKGVCPEIELYDVRVLNADGSADEFAVLAALQFVRFINMRSNHTKIHGVNLSLSLLHEVSNYACGATPVCDECERLVANGTVVVAAAGNYGRAQYMTSERTFDDGYRTVSITDPGNAPSVITVGATHRSEPHTYGVSYFSSRGPTGDGRPKPDLIAPGEKVSSTVPVNSEESLDGTSMAAPHVSGAAALLLCRYPEFVGKPLEIKRVLCRTATDLGRDHNFQGAGLLDILRALESL